MSNSSAPDPGLERSAPEFDVLGARLQKVRSIPVAERPLDGAAWLRCEEMQAELRVLLAGWRQWPEDGRCDQAVQAVALLLAAVDAAPAELEVFVPSGLEVSDRHVWSLRLFGPATVSDGGSSTKQTINEGLIRGIWGRPGDVKWGEGRPAPDDLLKIAGTAYWMSFEVGTMHGAYESLYALVGCCLRALSHSDVVAAVGARLRQLRSPLSVEGLVHVLAHQSCLLGSSLFNHPDERTHDELQGELRTCIQNMRRLRPASARTHYFAAHVLIELGQPAVALATARRGLQLLAQQGGREPYHAALLHYKVAKALETSRPGDSTARVNVAMLREELAAAKACRDSCSSWLPTMLRDALRRQRNDLPIPEQRVDAAAQAGHATLPAIEISAPVGRLAAAGTLPPQFAQPRIVCASTRKCDGCGNVVAELRKCGRCKRAEYCSRDCQKQHWQAGHEAECHEAGGA